MECKHRTWHQALAGDGGFVKRSVEVNRPLRELAERSGVQANLAAIQEKKQEPEIKRRRRPDACGSADRRRRNIRWCCAIPAGLRFFRMQKYKNTAELNPGSICRDTCYRFVFLNHAAAEMERKTKRIFGKKSGNRGEKRLLP